MKAYAPLSKKEVEILSRLEYENIRIVSRNYLFKIIKDANQVDKLIYNLCKKGRLQYLAMKKYLVVPIKAPFQQWKENEFLIADALMEGRDYYIGYNNMFNFYGFIQQVPQAVFILNLKYSKSVNIGGTNYNFIKVNRARYYGITTLKINGAAVKISDREKTIVDMVYNYRPFINLKNIYKIIVSRLPEIDIGKFIKYATKFPNPTTRKRIGYVLDELCGIEKNKLRLLRESIKNTSLTTLYEIKSRRGKVSKNWNLIINKQL